MSNTVGNSPFSYYQYCMEYFDNFPQDYKTALNFIECNFTEGAKFWATTREESIKIALCLRAARNTYRRLKVIYS